MNLPSARLSLTDQLLEFDLWITPSLGEVRDTPEFRNKMERVVKTVELMGRASGCFSSADALNPSNIAQTFIEVTESYPLRDRIDALTNLASFLFLATGKSDNNAKCQIPLFIRDIVRWTTFPRVVRGHVRFDRPLPRVLHAEDYMALVAKIDGHRDLQKQLLEQFIGFVLSDKEYTSQVWSIGRSYYQMKSFGSENLERLLLSPLVAFQVRGSVTAKGGHSPEERLRATMDEWGMERGIDYNITDVVVSRAGNSEDGRREKKRHCDFVLPFQVHGFPRRLYIQCQFYAGDSGSVSHKNVDQTKSSRRAVAESDPNALFLEYVDGAGYFSSLNTDLKSLLSMETTAGFFQVRSAPVRLRRQLQQIGFLCPIELEHAIFRTDGSVASVRKALVAEGYARAEVDRVIESSVQRGLIQRTANSDLRVEPERRDLARRYFLLDVAAITGSQTKGRPVSGYILVPGYGPFHGAKMDDLVDQATRIAPSLADDWSTPRVVLGDVRWLCERGYVTAC